MTLAGATPPPPP
ncbi:hypothetical protein CP02DC16_0729A, partial [Chlamydia psittaci 02DC16]